MGGESLEPSKRVDLLIGAGIVLLAWWLLTVPLGAFFLLIFDVSDPRVLSAVFFQRKQSPDPLLVYLAARMAWSNLVLAGLATLLGASGEHDARRRVWIQLALPLILLYISIVPTFLSLPDDALVFSLRSVTAVGFLLLPPLTVLLGADLGDWHWRRKVARRHKQNEKRRETRKRTP